MSKLLKATSSTEKNLFITSKAELSSKISSCKPTPCYRSQVHLDLWNQNDIIVFSKNSLLLRQLRLEIWYDGPTTTLSYTRLANFDRTIKCLRKVQIDLSCHLDLSRALAEISKGMSFHSKLLEMEILINETRHVPKKGLFAIIKTLKMLPNLKKFFMDLTECEWFGNLHMKTLMSGLRSVSSLRNLNLALREDPKLGLAGLKYLIVALENMNYLKELALDLSYDKKMIDNFGLKVFSKSLAKQLNLRELKLNFGECDSIKFSGFQIFVQGIEQLSSLEKLKLLFSGFIPTKDKWIGILSKALKNLEKLNELELSFSGNEGITNKSISKISRAILALKKLEMLNFNFSDNKITEEAIQELSIQSKKVHSLKTLYLAVSNIEPQKMRQMFSHLNFVFVEI